MQDVTVKSLVANDAKATFQYCRRGQLWYETDSGFKFPVPIDDIGDASFHAEERAMLLMRYIRKQLDAVKEEMASMQENNGAMV